MGLLDKLFRRTWRHYRDRGDRYKEQGEAGLALHEYREALRRCGEEEAEARAALEEAIVEVRAGLMEMQLERAQGFVKVGKLERAIEAFDSARDHATSDAQVERIEGLIAEASQRASAEASARQQAREQVSAADADISMNPEHERFFVLLGGLDDAQVQRYEGFGPAFRDGYLALHDGDARQAVRHFKRARKASGDDPFILAEQGRALLLDGRTRDACAVLASADEQAADSVYIKLRRAEALWHAERFGEAEEVLQAAHDLDPKSERVLLAIAEHALRAGDHASGIDAVRAMLDRRPSDVSLLRLLGQLHQGAGDLDAALAAFEHVNKLRWRKDPSTGALDLDPMSALSAALIYIEQEKKLDRALTLLGGLHQVTQDADQVNVLLAIARVHELKKEPGKASAAIEQALTLIPDNAHQARAQVLARLKAFEQGGG